MKLKLSVLQDYSSLKSFLKDELHLSGGSLKKSELKKAYLEKPLRKGDVIELPINILNTHCISPQYDGPEFGILYDDENFLILNKPSGTHGHPLTYDESDNCLSWMRANGYGEYLNINSSEHERGLLYRLDKETSGVLFYVKKEEVYLKLRKNFSTIAKEKIYHALVSNEPKAEFLQSELIQYFSPSGARGSVMKVDDSEGEHAGVMEVKLLGKHAKGYLLEIKLKTGLRHQIRAGLAHLELPIVGDQVYGGETAPRLYLHASRYSLELDGEVISGLSPTSFDLSLDSDNE